MPNNPPIAKNKRGPIKRKSGTIKGDYIHTRSWRKVRASYMQEQPICERCKYNNDITFMSTYKLSVHHIRLRVKNEHLQDDFCNLLTLCTKCHGYFSMLENNGKEAQAVEEGEQIKTR